MSQGQDLLDIANAAWDEDTQEYRGFQYRIAVNQAKKQIDRVPGNRKARKESASHTVDVMFTHARSQSAERLDTVARSATTPTSTNDPDSDVSVYAAEVASMVNGPLSGGYGIIDPAMIIGLIQAIIQAVSACKKPQPTPTPTPAS